jgi:hypothetical protein
MRLRHWLSDALNTRQALIHYTIVSLPVLHRNSSHLQILYLVFCLSLCRPSCLSSILHDDLRPVYLPVDGCSLLYFHGILVCLLVCLLRPAYLPVPSKVWCKVARNGERLSVCLPVPSKVWRKVARTGVICLSVCLSPVRNGARWPQQGVSDCLSACPQ